MMERFCRKMRLYLGLRTMLLCILLFLPLAVRGNSDMPELVRRAYELIGRMSTEEKISQLMNESSGIDRLGILPYNWWNEALHGVARNGKATVFPQPITLACTFDPRLLERIGDAVSDEARAKFHAAQRMKVYEMYAGLTFWSPNVNIFRDPRWGRGMETYGEDPYLTSELGVSYVRGMQGSDPVYLKTAACAKHYAVHSGPEALRHEFDAVVTDKELYETYLPAFEALVKRGKVEAVMGAYNRVNGKSASAHPRLFRILREDWGFEGHIVSDCGAVRDIFSGHRSVPTEEEAAALAIKSGLNLECGNSFRTLKKALERGLLTDSDLDQALLPLILTKMKLGLFDGDSPYSRISSDVICCPEHRALALESAEKGIVLLQNRGHVLPLKKDLRTLYVTGPFATDGNVLLGNYYGVPVHLSTYLEAISSEVSAGTRLMYKPGILATVANSNPIDWATGDAFQSEATIVFLGESNCSEGEEGDAIASSTKGDRLSLSLPEHQLAYLRKISTGNRNKIITVVNCGGPFDAREICELSDAVVWVGYPGQEGGNALANILFGDVSPSGRLPVTFPTSVDVLPDFSDYSMRGRTYRYQRDGILFPFGYGLSYSSVTYSGLQLSNRKDLGRKSVTLSVRLKNTGRYPVEEVAQVYLKTPRAGEDMPLSSLVSFERVFLSAGEEKVVSFEITPDRLKMVGADGRKVLLTGKYQLLVSQAAPGERSHELGIQLQSIEFFINSGMNYDK